MSKHQAEIVPMAGGVVGLAVPSRRCECGSVWPCARGYGEPHDADALRRENDPEYADWRKCGEYIGFSEYKALRQLWRDLGGDWFGPTVEHGAMSEAKLLHVLRRLRAANA